MKTWKIFIVPVLLVLTACATPTSVGPAPTIVRLSQSIATEATQAQASAQPSLGTDAAPAEAATPAPATDVALAATVTPTPSAQPPVGTAVLAPKVQAEVVADELNERMGPGVEYAVAGTVTKGALLEITGATADGSWLQVTTADGASAWVSGREAYTRIIGSLSDVPVVETASSSGATAAVMPVSYTATDQTAAASSQTASMTAAAAGGKLVFTTQSGGDLYVVNADGTGLRKLTSGVIDPVVSPDGQQVAFTRWDGAEMGTLYVINVDGSGERVVLSETLQAKSPTWSPDGQSIVVSFQHGGLRDPQPECREFDRDDHVRLPENITITKVHMDGDGILTICFIRNEDLRWGLRQVTIATGKFEDLPADLYSYNPAWDPTNASRVIYSGEKGLMQLDVTTGKLQSFTSDASDGGPVFSPDGQTLALTYKQHDHWEVYTYDLASGSRQRLTKPSILADPQYSSAAPAWSPDSTQIAFLTDRTGQWEIWVMNADGSNPHAMFSSEAQAQLGLDYQGVNEKMLNWID
jgi:uncharacterized protein YgiM (DUF1202 family)